MQALIGKKIGMTRVYDDDGVQVPVTVVQVGPCTVVQRKRAESDGYEAVQLGFIEQKEQRLTLPEKGISEGRREADEGVARGASGGWRRGRGR